MDYPKNIAIRVFIKPEDDEDSIKETLFYLSSLEKEDFEKIIKREVVEGFNNRKITILRLNLTKRKHIRKFLEQFMKNLSKEDLMILKQQVESRVDKFCHFFIRLEKNLLQKGVYAITDKGNCFHFDITLPIYPCKRENAINYVKEMLDYFLEMK